MRRMGCGVWGVGKITYKGCRGWGVGCGEFIQTLHPTPLPFDTIDNPPKLWSLQLLGGSNVAAKSELVLS